MLMIGSDEWSARGHVPTGNDGPILLFAKINVTLSPFLIMQALFRGLQF